MSVEYTTLPFNDASLSLLPYAGNSSTSSNLLKSIISKLNDPDFPSEKRIIDRHENRKNSVSRKLVIISAPYERGGQRCWGKIALIKNKAPLLWGGQDIVEEIAKEKNKRFIEVTNFVVHFHNSSAEPIIMFEFNNEGPRLSDIEYYIRQIATEYKLAKRIQSIIHLKTNYGQLDRDIENVFNLTVKVNSTNTGRTNWLKSLINLRDDSGFKDVRLELFYRRQIDNAGKYMKNIRGTDLARNIIGWLKRDGKNIDYLDDLKMSYQLSSSDEIVELDFLKNKVGSFIKIPLTDGNIYTPKDFKFAVGQEFNIYLSTGKTTDS